MKERCDREWSQRSFWCSLGEIRGWDHNPKQLNNQQRGQHRRLGNAHGARDDLVETSCRGWGCKQSRPLPRAVRAAKLCPRCSPSPGRELQIRRKRNVAAALGISRARAYKLAHSADFPAVQIGKRIVVSRKKFLGWLNRQSEEQKCAWRGIGLAIQLCLW